MMNMLFNQFGQPNQFSQLIQQARQFKQNFSGNPREKVQELLNSGRMSQQQFNEYAKIANQVGRFMR